MEAQCQHAANIIADPASEAWTTILLHPSIVQDAQVVCKLLQVSHGYAAAVHAQLAGRLSVQLTAGCPNRAQQFASWMHRNGIILQDIQIALAEASSGADRASSATAATVEIAAAVVSMGLSLLAGNPLLVPPQLPASAVAPATGLQSFTARGIIASSASQLTASLHGVASQLTHFELGLLMRMQPDQWGETPFAVPPSTAGLPVLAGMRNLRSLVLHQPCEVHANMGSGMWPPFTDCLQQCVSNMQQLTRLELPVHMGDFEGLQEMEQYLPASLQELRLGADAGVAGDEGAIAFGVTEADDVLMRRQRHPMDLSALTALTKLQLSALVPIVSADVLPDSLLQLHARQCFSLQPLLQLTNLQMLAMRASTIPAFQLAELTELTSLTAVKLFYEGGYQFCGEFTHWSSERIAEQAAVWVKLPVVSVGLYEGSGPYEGGVFGPLTLGLSQQLQKLQGLTKLTLDWPLDFKVLAGIAQLKQLRVLSLHWGWYDEYVGSRWSEHTAEELAVCADIVLRVMHGFVSLPHLQELSWLCDEDRALCLSLKGLKDVMQELGDRAQLGAGKINIQELAQLVEPHMETYEY